jgi:pimeloyl-ACP methyl ester carboxylesterase
LRERDHDALVVFGDADAYIAVEQAHRQREVFPRAEIRVLPGVGHWCWLEATDAVAAEVVPFLQQRIGRAQ